MASPWFELVGKPYEFPSDPPRSFDCWTLVKHVRLAERLACPLPFDDREAWCVPGNLAHATALAASVWRTQGGPVPFAMAVLEPGHVGVVIDGGVLHALARNASVVWTTFAVVRRQWPQAQWWTA
jgi:hypothetical protein